MEFKVIFLIIRLIEKYTINVYIFNDDSLGVFFILKIKINVCK